MRIMRSSSGRPFISPSVAYEKFRHNARTQLMTQTYGVCFRKQVRVSLTFYLKGKIDADVDNLVSSIFDILADSNIIENDKLITEVTAIKLAGCREFETEVSIEGET